MEFQSKFRKSLSLEKVFEDSIWYKLSCDCMDDRHNTIISFSVREGIEDMIEFEIFQNLEINSHYFGVGEKYKWYEKIIGYYDVIKYRVQKSIRLLFTGELQIDSHVLLYGEEHIDSMIECLYEGKEFVRNFIKEKELRRIKENEDKDKLCDK